ncbi:hydrogenase isoenzymes formation protein HypC [Clostridium acetireducens DSM 10703]|jgi:hydrogenase expression/formation protein HypC|uniref:Hydrogenase isoenzymes formation protein HypC n=1 Tax=Clostridium acetireducens DSM 10703 TaxID=1121290 RepID=A0A1E8F1T7_9CLOT|nr:HypC/HybG/HupF family hydrogenase formation chaperone [Clostridium acetireducens]OFI07121.1 hydrogenase isoenzymes formation protein HypC [Clostridium acetireducens DSM 10703]
MCIAVPVKVLSVYENEALIEFSGIKKKVNTSLIDNLKVGDYVLLHAGCAIEKVDKYKAEETLKLFNIISEEM